MKFYAVTIQMAVLLHGTTHLYFLVFHKNDIWDFP